MLRPIAIAMIFVLSVSIMLPFANSAHGIRQTVEVGKSHHRRHRSRAWWRRYRARQRQKKLAAEMAHRNALLTLPQNISVADLQGLSGPTLPSLPANAAASTTLPPPVMTASVVSAPSVTAAKGETRPRVVNAPHPAFTPAAAPLPGSMK